MLKAVFTNFRIVLFFLSIFIPFIVMPLIAIKFNIPFNERGWLVFLLLCTTCYVVIGAKLIHGALLKYVHRNSPDYVDKTRFPHPIDYLLDDDFGDEEKKGHK